MLGSLPVINLERATFECRYGRGCEGWCCHNSRPPVTAEEQARIDAHLDKFLPEMRPAARRLVEREGFVSNRHKAGRRMVRVIDSWCVFFHNGCVLHKIGAAEGDRLRYKPLVCALFPMDRTPDGRWYVRQKGFQGEEWNLACLDPGASAVPAAESLREELELVAGLGKNPASGGRQPPVGVVSTGG